MLVWDLLFGCFLRFVVRLVGYNVVVRRLVLRYLLRFVADVLRRIARSELPESCHDCADDLLDLFLEYWRDYA